MFEFKRAPLSLVVSKALLDTSSVGLMNLCLSHNSVGTWQVPHSPRPLPSQHRTARHDVLQERRRGKRGGRGRWKEGTRVL
eukprot:981162-Rhodomonas_salina.2